MQDGLVNPPSLSTERGWASEESRYMMKEHRRSIMGHTPAGYFNKLEVRVIYADTDHGGAAYYGTYLRWFEMGRTELLRSAGLTYAEIEKSGIISPVVEVRCRYLQPARYDEILEVVTWIEELRRGSITFGYQIMRKADHALIALGETTNAFVDHELRCTRPPKAIHAALSSLAGGGPATPE